MNTYTYTHAYTRARAVVDQVDVLFKLAGIDDDSRSKICHGVEQRWLEAVGLYLSRNGRRVYEVEARISWSAYSDQTELEFSTDLPGWEHAGSPEAVVLGSRFAAVARENGLSPRYWASFTTAICSNPAEHQRLCPQVGVVFNGRVPDWSKTPRTHSISLQDLGEVGMSERTTL